MTLKIIGAGFGRTGTMSLKVALEQLGFDKCYHMREVIRHPSHAPIWQAAWMGDEVEWSSLFAGYQAAVDWPPSAFYKQLMAQYPDAKLILTVRDPERWYQSAFETIYSEGRSLHRLERALLPKRVRDVFAMIDAVIWQGTFAGRFGEREYAIQMFNDHNAEVKQVVPAEKLLIFRAKEGWKPLCAFLGVPEPDSPFPHVNDSAQFKRNNRVRRILLLLLPFVAAGGAVALIWLIGKLIGAW